MEIILNSPNLYIHYVDALVMVQFLVDGLIEVVGKFKI